MLKVLQASLQQYVNWELQMYKLDLENAKEPEIKLPTFFGSERKQGSFRKTSTSTSLTVWKPLTMCITTKFKFLREMGIPDHLTCLLRNLCMGQEATVRNLHGTTDWFKIGKAVQQGCILPPCLFKLYAEHIMWNARLEESQTGIKIARRNINNLRYPDDNDSNGRRLKRNKGASWWGWKRRVNKAGLKVNIKKKELRSWCTVPSLHGE